jgi:membrane protein
LGGIHGRRLTACETAPVVRKRQLATKFFADRGPHLAAMVAYFALLSFVPLTFLALALLGLAHRADASDFLVRELSRAFPGTSLASILKLLHEVQDNAATLGIIGGIALLWSSLSLFSALESAFNIVYGLPNRSFLRGKALAATLMIATITLLFVSLLVGSLGVEVLKRYAPGFVANAVVAYIVSIAVSLLGVFLFLLAVYWLLPTADVGPRDALPGAAFAAILLLWLYVMANVIVFGAELNWWRSERIRLRHTEPVLEGLA